VAETTAREIFELITFFGGYGFNKSHSAAYALIGYQTAYLKAHHPAEFMAALLSSEIEDSNKRDIMVQHIEDAKKLGAEVLPPDVQAGDVDFTAADNKIFFGLTAIKGLGRGAAAEIVRARTEKGPFKDLFDFCERVDHKLVPKSGIEKLIKAGAFDNCGGNRAQLWEALPRAIASAGEVQEDRRHGQGSLFGVEGAEADGPQAAEGLRDIPEWPANEKLKYEKEALDFYISSHPLAEHGDDLGRFSTHTVSQLAELGPNQEVFMGGMLTQVRFMNTKKARNGNSRYVRCKLEDFTGSVECVMWPDDYVRHKDLIVEDRIVFVAGAVERNREEPGLVLTKVVSPEQGKRERTTGLVLLLDLAQHSPGLLGSVASVLRRARGSLPVFLHIQDAAGKWLKLKSSDEFRINPDTLVKTDLETILGQGRVQFARQANGNGRNGH
jgi:DNA polymerase-3 subunit alpha